MGLICNMPKMIESLAGVELYAVGHFALGYLTAKLTGRFTKTQISIPIVLTLSVIPDIDLLVPFLDHRGPSHSLLVAIVIFIPVIVLFGKNGFPYLVALVQHSLLGDFFTGNVQLFWPITSYTYGIALDIRSPVNVALEWTAFLVMFAEMLRSKDLQLLIKPGRLNMVLAIPTFTVLLPTFLAFPLRVPAALMAPHIVMLILFSISMLADVKKAFQNLKRAKSAVPH